MTIALLAIAFVGLATLALLAIAFVGLATLALLTVTDLPLDDALP